MKALIQFDTPEVGLVLGDLTIDYAKRLDGTDIDTTGATLVELGFGAYVFELSGTSGDAAFRVHITAFPNVAYAGEFPRLLESIFQQLVAQHESGTITVPGGSLTGDTLVLIRQNSYVGLTFTIGSEWTAYLAGGYQVFLTAKSWKTDPLDNALFDVACAIIDADLGVVSTDLTPTDMDHPEMDNGYWQIQIREAADPPSVVKVPMEGKLVITPLIRDVASA